jgi:hypothetical protein
MNFFQAFMAVFGAIIGALVLYFIICSIRDALRERRRRRAFQRLAVELGLSYEARDDNLVEHLGLVHALRQGKRSRLYYILGAPPVPRYAFNVLSGSYAGFSVRAFDFFCDPERGSGKYLSEMDVHCINVLMVVEQKPFPAVLIYSRKRWMRLEQMVKLERVELEAAEFAHAFVVRAHDRKFAYDICHPRMMEYLLEHRDLSLEIEGRCVAMSFDRRLKPEDIPGRLQQLIEIRRLFPEYLYRP